MCLVIDANCFGLVFGSVKGHENFIPVLNWIAEGNGRMIYGGTKYNVELSRAGWMLRIVAELTRSRRVIRIPNATIDPIAAALKVKFPEPEFDDEHIVALVIASRCCVVCTKDNPAISYLKRVDVFADWPGIERPKIYKGDKRHAGLCCDQHVVRICREQA